MTRQEHRLLARSYLGKQITLTVDRPIGYVHHKSAYTLTYPINYGFLPGVIGGDGEELDVYLLGVDAPVSSYTARVIGIVYREDDVEDKLVAAPDGMNFTAAQIDAAIHFQEKYHQSRVEALFEKSCGTIPYTWQNGAPHYLLIRSRKNGVCGFPKGHVEGEETEEETALRETREETSLQVEICPGTRAEITYRMGNGKIKQVAYFLAHYSGQEAHHCQGFEHNDYLLLPYEEAYAALTFDNTRQLLQQAHAHLS